MTALSHDGQVSPDKNVNFPRTAAAFTLSPEPVGFVVLCQLARRLSLVCGFCSSARAFALRLPSDARSPSRPCLRLILVVAFIRMNTSRFSYRGLPPHKFTPMPGVHKRLNPTRVKRLGFLIESLAPNETDFINECKNKISKGRSQFDPSVKGKIFISKWSLLIPVGFCDLDKEKLDD